MIDKSNLSVPLLRMEKQLLEAGVDPSATAVILERTTVLAQEAATLKIAATIGEKQYQELCVIDNDQERAAAIDHAYTEKSGQLVRQLEEEMLEKTVQDFEKN